ncbi:MAG: DUF6263 family protein [Planctomycetota bacterium]
MLSTVATRPCDAQVTLTKKLPENTAYATANRQKVTQAMTIAGMKQDTSSEQNSVVRNRIGKRDPDGSVTVISDIRQLQAQLKIPTIGDVTFDSVNPDKATESPLTPLLKAVATMEWKSTYDRNHSVTSVNGHDKALESLDGPLRDGVKKRYEPDYLRSIANDALNRIPTKPIKVGDSWEQTSIVRLDSAQSLTFTKKYTYRGTVNQEGKTLDKIEVSTTAVKLEIEGAAGVPLKLIKSNLKIGKSSGALFFDRQLGRIVSENENIQIVGPITLGVGDQQLPADIDLTLESEMNERPGLLN